MCQTKTTLCTQAHSSTAGLNLIRDGLSMQVFPKASQIPGPTGITPLQPALLSGYQKILHGNAETISRETDITISCLSSLYHPCLPFVPGFMDMWNSALRPQRCVLKACFLCSNSWAVCDPVHSSSIRGRLLDSKRKTNDRPNVENKSSTVVVRAPRMRTSSLGMRTKTKVPAEAVASILNVGSEMHETAMLVTGIRRNPEVLSWARADESARATGDPDARQDALPTAFLEKRREQPKWTLSHTQAPRNARGTSWERLVDSLIKHQNDQASPGLGDLYNTNQ